MPRTLSWNLHIDTAGKKNVASLCSGHDQLQLFGKIYKPFQKIQTSFTRFASPSFANLTKAEVNEFVYVTAASDNHFAELKAGLSQLRLTKCKRLVLVYDLGMSTEHQQEVPSILSPKNCPTKIHTVVFVLFRSSDGST